MLDPVMNPNPRTTVPLASVLAELRAAAASPFESAAPIPASVNHSLEFLDHEREAVFLQEWICIGREDEIPAPGDFLTHQVAEVAVLVVRQADSEIRAFVNACAHRFACLVPEQSGSRKRFTCRYHAWTYDIGGELVRAPYMEMKTNFDVTEHRLRALLLNTWEGFIYVSLAQNPSSRPDQVLAPLADKIVGRYDMGCYRTVLRESMEWNANWKNLVENFTESYHVPIAHGQTFAQHNKALEDYVCGEDSDHYCYHYAAQMSDSGLGAAHPLNDRLEDEWRRTMVDFCVFPNHLVTLMPDYLWYISVQPLGVDRMQATWSVAVPPEVLADVGETDYDDWLSQFKQYIDIANDEDRTLVEALHQGSASALLPTGTYHPIERNLWQFTRYLARVCQA
jgi:phenylpropionate dioxygenase-like ring-hydroxylating dioxygenase large terminal subunit